MWETLTTAWGSLLEPLGDPVTLAIPAFVVFLGLEWFAARKLEETEIRDGRAYPPTAGYEFRDARASISMGLVSIATTAFWKFLALIGYSAIWVYLAPWHLPANAWYTWVLLLVGIDLLYYTYHRMAHRIRLIWATHQAHHSSEYFNFATALRQKWNNSGEILMWIPLPLIGIPPWMIFVGFSVSLVYQDNSSNGLTTMATCAQSSTRESLQIPTAAVDPLPSRRPSAAPSALVRVGQSQTF